MGISRAKGVSDLFATNLKSSQARHLHDTVKIAYGSPLTGCSILRIRRDEFTHGLPGNSMNPSIFSACQRSHIISNFKRWRIGAARTGSAH